MTLEQRITALAQAIGADVKTLFNTSGGTPAWGNVTGTLSDQTDLQSALDGKQAADADLTALAALTPSADAFIVGNGSTWATASGDSALAALGATTVGRNFLKLAFGGAFLFPRINTDGSVTALTANNFRSSINAQPAGSYQPLDADLTTIAALTPSADAFIVGDGTGWVTKSGAAALAALGVTTVGTGDFVRATNPLLSGVRYTQTVGELSGSGQGAVVIPATSDHFTITNGLVDGDSVTLPVGITGKQITVTNATGSDIFVYPAVDEEIWPTGSTDLPYPLATGQSCTFTYAIGFSEASSGAAWIPKSMFALPVTSVDGQTGAVNLSGTYQTLDDDLTAIAGLQGTSGFLKKTAADTWSLDTSTYLTGNQSITLSGDATGSGATSIAVTLANSGVTAGTYKSVTVDAKGRVTGGTNPTTLAGYGITDAASSTHTHSSLQATDNRTLTNPTTGLGYSATGRFRFSSLNDNNSTPYADVIDLSTYSDASGGGFNALYLGKNSQLIQHKYAAAGATAWTVKTIAYTDSNITGSAGSVAASGITGQTGMWTSAARPGPYRLYRRENDSNYSVQTYWTGTYWHLGGYNGDTYHAGCQVAYADNADTVDGLHIHTGTNNEANKLVRTDGSGYIQAGWINTISGDLGLANKLNRVWCSNDQYMRYLTLADFKTQMGLSAKSSHNRRENTTDANYFVGSMGWSGVGANEVFHGGSGFFDIWSGTNFPSGTSHIHGFNALHYTTNSYGSTGSSAYGIQVAGQYNLEGEIWSRGCSNGTFSAWRKQIDSVNYSGYNSYGTLYTNNWFRSTGQTGWYSETYAVGIWATEAGNVRTYNSANFIAGGNVTAYSDIRLKENIEVIPNALEKVMALEGVTFTRNDMPDTEKRHTGVIAQQVLEVLPEAVNLAREDDYYTVAYGNLVGLLIEAIKEQQKQIEVLMEKVNG